MKNKFIDWSGEEGRYGVGRSGIRYFIQTGTGASYGTYYPTWVDGDGTRYIVPVSDPDEFDGTIRASKTAARKFEQRRQQRQPALAAVTGDELRTQAAWYRTALTHWPDGINADVYRATISVLERAATTIDQNC
ncbi:hypothetical protein [Curtobacterium sp. MCSS17_016]|uniref:hypothetical protein n=1 Tax=Curtobacterium sp. MCSS17_016 TaxID=2175644 RepID=UPI000DAA6792|nr:hypothetical protein [Curtobacterium sp. MCSS17_016]WIE81044.1 hypothetical protein DEJ19_021240 [Curtobacterium sp. MCSS17_016]